MLEVASRKAAAAAAIAVAAAGGFWILHGAPGAPPQALAGQARPAEAGPLPGSFADLIERVNPSVVSIRVTKPSDDPSQPIPGIELPESLKRFFGEDFARRFGFPQGEREGEGRRAPRARGVGSGFFIDADGHVVTNSHVVRGADRIEVGLQDGNTYEARLIGDDPKTDLALLKVDAGRRFPGVRLGSSGAVRVGDWVVAIGSPFGLGHSVTAGIVSARGRDIGAGPYDDFLQLDAPINQGNSGGPTFNVRGEVIGVNTAIMSPTGVSAGVGFAIPSDLARKVIGQLRETGKVARGWLGVRVQTVTEDLARGLGLEKAEGALVAAALEDGPAARAGVRQGDVILAVDGERVDEMRSLPRLVADLAAGADARLTVMRGGAETEIDVRIGAMPEAEQLAAAAAPRESGVLFGMKLAPLDDGLRGRFGVVPEVEGVAVVEVAPGSPAAEKDVRPGDVLRQVSGRGVKTPAEAAAAVAAAREASGGERRPVLLLVSRNGDDRFVALAPEGG